MLDVLPQMFDADVAGGQFVVAEYQRHAGAAAIGTLELRLHATATAVGDDLDLRQGSADLFGQLLARG